MTDTLADRILRAMSESAARQYGRERVSELTHALQCADLAMADAVRLRRWDDHAKVIDKATRPLSAWVPL